MIDFFSLSPCSRHCNLRHCDLGFTSWSTEKNGASNWRTYDNMYQHVTFYGIEDDKYGINGINIQEIWHFYDISLGEAMRPWGCYFWRRHWKGEGWKPFSQGSGWRILGYLICILMYISILIYIYIYLDISISISNLDISISISHGIRNGECGMIYYIYVYIFIYRFWIYLG